MITYMNLYMVLSNKFIQVEEIQVLYFIQQLTNQIKILKIESLAIQIKIVY